MFSRIRHHLDKSSSTPPKPPTETKPRSHGPLANAVYYPNWRVYRQQPPSSLRLGCVSHVFYAFAWVREDGIVYLSDEWADAQIPLDGTTGCLRALANLKHSHPHLRLILSIGGGGKGSDNFPLVAGSRSRTETFARSARGLVDLFALDGVDIDWEHPSTSSEGVNYIHLLARLRQVFPSPRYVLATCLPAGEWALSNINLSKAAQYLDFLNIMAYDFAGPWSPQSGHHAALHSTSKSPISCHSAVSYVLRQGVPSPKLLLGVPVYGRSFLGCSKPGKPYRGSGGEDGVFDFRDLPRPNTKEVVDEKVGAAFCVGGDGGFVSYDTPATVAEKARFAAGTRLGGLFYWQGAADAESGQRSLVESGFRALHGG